MRGSSEIQWRHHARRAARLANFGWWLDGFFPFWIGLSVCLAASLLILRRRHEPTGLCWILDAAALLAGAWIAGRIMRQKFRSPAQSLAELDAFYRLDNRLSAAAAAIGPWPVPPREFSQPLAVNWPRVAGNGAVPLALIALAALVPIGQADSFHASPSELPPSLAQIKNTLDRIEEKKIADPAVLADAQKAVAQLSQGPSENWYKQSTLEAAQNLREQTADSLRAMDQQLTEARDALRSVKDNLNAKNSTVAAARQQRLDRALAGLKNLPMGLDPKLAEQLEKLSGQDLMQMSPEQISQLEQALNELQTRSEESLDQAGPGEGMALGQKGKNGSGPTHPNPGQGSPAESPESKPLALRDDNPSPGQARLKTVSSQDKQPVMPGDRVGESDRKPEIDTQASPGSTSAGPVDLKANGGDAVWQSSFTPDEQETLIRFFR